MTPRLKQLALAVWQPIECRAAAAYFAGPALVDALGTADRMSALGYGVVLAFWNADGADQRDVARENLSALAALRPRGPDWYLSLKAPALGYSRDLVEQIAGAEAATGRIVHFDSHEHDTADGTVALAVALRETRDEVGITIPGRWERSIGDAERAVDAGLRVRVVKGEWPDPDRPDLDMVEGFLAVIDRLAGRGRHVSVATHDHELAREAISRLSTAGTSHDIELLLGLPFARTVAVAQAAGLPARVYVPYGHAALRYGVGYLRRNPRRIWWLARDVLLRRQRRTPPPYRLIETRSRSSSA